MCVQSRARPACLSERVTALRDGVRRLAQEAAGRRQRRGQALGWSVESNNSNGNTPLVLLNELYNSETHPVCAVASHKLLQRRGDVEVADVLRTLPMCSSACRVMSASRLDGA